MRQSGDREVGSSYDLLTLCMRSESGCDGTRPSFVGRTTSNVTGCDELYACKQVVALMVLQQL